MQKIGNSSIRRENSHRSKRNRGNSKVEVRKNVEGRGIQERTPHATRQGSQRTLGLKKSIVQFEEINHPRTQNEEEDDHKQLEELKARIQQRKRNKESKLQKNNRTCTWRSWSKLLVLDLEL